MTPSNIAGVPKIPNPYKGGWTDGPLWGNPGKPNPNSRKGTDDPKHKKQTDASMLKNQQAQVKTHHIKYHWWIWATNKKILKTKISS